MTEITIWKFKLPDMDHIVNVEMPKGAIIQSCGYLEGEGIVIWARFEDQYRKELETRSFIVLPTGSTIGWGEKLREFIGTIIIKNDILGFHILPYLIWHVFETDTWKDPFGAPPT